MTRSESTELATESEEIRAWLDVRKYLGAHRHDLTPVAAAQYDAIPKVLGTQLLTAKSWMPQAAIPLSDVRLRFEPDRSFAGLLGTESSSEAIRPHRTDGLRFDTYAAAMRELAAPKVFVNRSTYRLLDFTAGDLAPTLTFGRGTYFDGINVGEAAAHEFAAAQLDLSRDLPLRRSIGNPCDPSRRPINVAISTLTLRADRATGSAQFYLHWRDPSKVAHAGGLYQVLPVGIFQASGEASWNERNDFDLWRCTVREMAEELLGQSEDHGSEQAPIDYGGWPFARRLNDQLGEGIRGYFLGMGVDPLTLATDILSAVVIDAPLFDELFGDMVQVNAEGRLLKALGFTDTNIDRFVREEPMQAAGAAVLAEAWKHRGELLS